MAILRSAVALGVLAAVASAEARGGASPSPYAGAFTWNSLPVTISNRGQIDGSGPSPEIYSGSIQGRVLDDGSYSFTMTVTYPTIPDDFQQKGPKWVKVRYEFAGTLAPDAYGNLVATPTAGGSFVWLRQ